MFYIGYNRGFVKTVSDKNLLIPTHDVRQARTFDSFDEASELMHNSRGYKHFAILQVPGTIIEQG